MMEQFNGQVFVYGSLRSGFHHPAYEYISRYFTLVSEGKVKGSLYDMGEYPAAVPSEKDQFIIGELYRINNPEEFEWAIAQLDDYEGVRPEHGDTPLYRREQTIAYTKEGESIAWVYWFNRDISGRPNIEGGDVLLHIQQKNKS